MAVRARGAWGLRPATLHVGFRLAVPACAGTALIWAAADAVRADRSRRGDPASDSVGNAATPFPFRRSTILTPISMMEKQRLEHIVNRHGLDMPKLGLGTWP